MRATYANVVSTLALVLALGGTGAYAAGHLTGKDVKNGTLTGKDLKDRSVTDKDVAPGSIGTGLLSQDVRAALQPAPAPPDHVAQVDATISLKTDQVVVQPLGRFAGLDLTSECTRIANGAPSWGMKIYASAPGGRSFVNDQVYIAGSAASTPYNEVKSSQPADDNGRVLLALGAANDPAETEFGSFGLVSPAGTWSGLLMTISDPVAHTCRVTGWVQHP